MQNTHSVEDITDFLAHAGARGLMPAATAQAFAVATRNVFSVLDEAERSHLPLDDLDSVIDRFNNRRSRDFNPTSLREYGRRVRRSVDLYLKWKSDPANFSVKTRSTSSSRRKAKPNSSATVKQLANPSDRIEPIEPQSPVSFAVPVSPDGYSTAFPVRPGHIVSIANIPNDLTSSEAERLAQFIRLLAPS